MRRIALILAIVISGAVFGQNKSSKPILPKHSIGLGGIVTTINSAEGVYMEYQFHMDDQISYLIKPGVTGILGNTDSLNMIVQIGINYRLSTLTRPLRDRFFNAQPFAGFYPASIEYFSIGATETEEAKSRLGWSPMGVLGYSIIFANTISLDVHAGFGMSFRLAGKVGDGLTPVFMAGAGLGFRIR